MDLNKLEKLNELYQKGALTQDEFLNEKQKLYNEESGNSRNDSEKSGDLSFGLEPNRYMCLMNLVILLPSVGWIASIIFWVLGKDKSQQVNQQGKFIVNWFITWFIFGVILYGVFFFSMFNSIMGPHFGGGGLAMFGGMLVKMIPFLIFGFLCFILPIIGGIKSLDGIPYRYPLSIQFFK